MFKGKKRAFFVFNVHHNSHPSINCRVTKLHRYPNISFISLPFDLAVLYRCLWLCSLFLTTLLDTPLFSQRSCVPPNRINLFSPIHKWTCILLQHLSRSPSKCGYLHNCLLYQIMSPLCRDHVLFILGPTVALSTRLIHTFPTSVCQFESHIGW